MQKNQLQIKQYIGKDMGYIFASQMTVYFDLLQSTYQHKQTLAV